MGEEVTRIKKVKMREREWGLKERERKKGISWSFMRGRRKVVLTFYARMSLEK